MVDIVQLAEPQTVNLEVAGSNPVIHPKYWKRGHMCELEEHDFFGFQWRMNAVICNSLGGWPYYYMPRSTMLWEGWEQLKIIAT